MLLGSVDHPVGFQEGLSAGSEGMWGRGLSCGKEAQDKGANFPPLAPNHLWFSRSSAPITAA